MKDLVCPNHPELTLLFRVVGWEIKVDEDIALKGADFIKEYINRQHENIFDYSATVGHTKLRCCRVCTYAREVDLMNTK